MAAIILRGFGGMAPSANAKAIDPAIATYAQNLNQRFSDFRPLPVAANVGVAAAGQTLYRFETSGDFITRAGRVSFVRGPIPNDSTERTYYTGDGPPSVTDNTGNVRTLGVPAPADPPGVVVNVNDEYSEDDVEAAQAAALATFTSVVWDNCDRPLVGLSDADLAARFVPGPVDAPWMQSFVVPGSMVGGAFVPTNPSHQKLIDNRMGFHIGPSTDGLGGTTGWMDVHVRGAALVLNPGLKAALQAIEDPSDPAGARALISAEQADTVITSLSNDLKACEVARDASVARLRELKTELVTVCDDDSAIPDSMRAAVGNFFNRPDVSDSVAAAIDSAAAAIRSSMRSYKAPIDNPYVNQVV